MAEPRVTAFVVAVGCACFMLGMGFVIGVLCLPIKPPRLFINRLSKATEAEP